MKPYPEWSCTLSDPTLLGLAGAALLLADPLATAAREDPEETVRASSRVCGSGRLKGSSSPILPTVIKWTLILVFWQR